MVGSLSEHYETDRSSPKGVLSGQISQSKEALAEWRSSEQVENGTPSTSPSYWDTDEDDDSGARPSELYTKFDWKIGDFLQNSKKELKSTVFEAGGYKWYILIYPQGCDVCNHLSLFLCVANHDKLLPGWSHFAQFTIAVDNKDPKKSKYSDTLHRFTKKEHDWGWKKFMELSGLDGFIVDGVLFIKAQVQVIRDKAYRPFRCLAYQYRRELAHVYLTNVEQICRRFFEERRGKLRKLIEDKETWSSFSAFWLGIDQSNRRRMSREKTDVILKIIVKHFFVEKEVASTLVMDSLYSGLKALECQSKSKKSRAKPLDSEETSPPIVQVEKDMFVLADDVLLLLERAALEPLPPKDEKGPQNRTKDGSSREDFNKDSIERVERRLLELGRRTVEFFALAHIFSTRIEVAYQEAVALKRQEELIREEEAAGQAESEQKAKRGAAEKGKRAKKKQSKHRRNSQKEKDKERDEKLVMTVQYKQQQDIRVDKRTAGNFSSIRTLSMLENPDTLRDVNEISDTGEDVTEILQPELEDEDASSPANWDTDTSELHPYTEASSCRMSGVTVQNGIQEKKITSLIDDSSSTCSTDSVPSLDMTGPHKWSSLPNCKSRISPMRVKNRRGKDKRHPAGAALETNNRPAGSFTDALDDGSGICKAVAPESEADVLSLKDRINWLEQHLVEKEVEVFSLQRKLTVKDQVNVKGLYKESVEAEAFPSSNSSTRNPLSDMQPKEVAGITGPAKPVAVKETSSNSPQRTEPAVPLRIPSPHISIISKLDAQKPMASLKSPVILYENPTSHQASAMSKPSGAPLFPSPRPSAPIASVLQTAPLLRRSVSAAGQLATDSSLAHSNGPQSYRNAIMGKTICSSSACFTHSSSSSSVNPSPPYSQPSPVLVSLPVPSPQSSSRKDQGLVRSGFTFGSVSEDVLQHRPQWLDECSRPDASSMLGDIQKLGISGSANSGAQTRFGDEIPASVSASSEQGVSVHTSQGVSADEFPHLDIINYLLDEEHSVGKSAKASTVFQSSNNGHHQQLNRHLTFPGNMAMSADMGSSINRCRYDLPASYRDNGMQHVYGSSSVSFDGLKDVGPQVSLSSYATSEGMLGLIQNQWPVDGTHVSMLHTRNPNGDAYQYKLPEYSNLLCRVDGSSVFRPVNGR